MKPGAFSIYFGDAPIYHFDLDGRWQRAFVDGTHFLKGLDTTVQAVDRVREGENLVLRRRTLGFAEAADLDASIRSTAIDLAEACRLGALDSRAARRLQAAQPRSRSMTYSVVSSGWDAAAWFAHRERYLAAYGPLPFLPPEAASPLILQATLGPRPRPGIRRRAGRRVLRAYPRGDRRSRARRRPPARPADLAVPPGLHGRKRLPPARGRRRDRGPRRRGRGACRSARTIAPGPGEGRSWRRSRASTGSTPSSTSSIGRPSRPRSGRSLQARHFRTLILGTRVGLAARATALWSGMGRMIDSREWVASCPVGLGLVVVVGAGGEESARSHVEETVALVDSLADPARLARLARRRRRAGHPARGRAALHAARCAPGWPVSARS